MSRLVLALALLVTVHRTATADPDEPLYKCREMPAGSKLSVSFSPETSLVDLAVWVRGFSCKNVVFSADVAKYATRVTVVSGKEMTAKQAMALFVDAVEATGLVVTVKPDTIVVKLGPKMPKGCPDPAPARSPKLASAIDVTEAPPPEPSEITDADLAAGIKQLGPNKRSITHALVDGILANPMAASKGARIVPASKNGTPIGFKIYAIREGSLYSRIGLQNGDTVTRFNGMEVTSADKALEVYTTLRDAKALTIELTRAGKPVTLTITIVD